jgi:cation diffusion facilitator CzcD-associated flavoprotein CzcO
VDKYNLTPYIHLEHEIVRAKYDEHRGKWTLTIRRQMTGAIQGTEEFQDDVDVLFTGIGNLSRWTWPEIQGIESFQGIITHSADWKTGEGDPASGWEETIKSWNTKKVGVIGIVRPWRCHLTMSRR